MTEPALRDDEFEALYLRAYSEARQGLVDKGVLPRQATVFTRFGWLFEFVGAMQLGLLVASVSILINFLVVVVVLHLDVSRYVGFLYFGG